MNDADLRAILVALAQARIDDRHRHGTPAEILANLLASTRAPEIRLRARRPRRAAFPWPRNARVWPQMNDGRRVP